MPVPYIREYGSDADNSRNTLCTLGSKEIFEVVHIAAKFLPSVCKTSWDAFCKIIFFVGNLIVWRFVDKTESETGCKHTFEGIGLVHNQSDGALFQTVGSRRVLGERFLKMSMQLWQLLLRIVLTIGIEILVALWFGFRAKKQLITVTVTNVITQVLLNVALFMLYLKKGAWAYIGLFIPLELAVFVIEAVTYKILLPRYSETEKEQRPVLYAFVANLLSMLLGGLIVFLCR